MQDTTGPLTIKQFEATGFERLSNPKQTVLPMKLSRSSGQVSQTATKHQSSAARIGYQALLASEVRRQTSDPALSHHTNPR